MEGENTLINNNGEIKPEVDPPPNNDTKSYYNQAKEYYNQAKEYAGQGMSYIYENKGTFSWILILSVCILIIFILIGIFGSNNKNSSDITRKNITANGDCTIDGTLTIAGKPYNAGAGGGGTYTYGDTLTCSTVMLNTKTYIKNGCGNNDNSCIDFMAPLGYNFYVVAKNAGDTISSTYNIFNINTDGVSCVTDFKCYGYFYLGELISATGEITGNACKIYSDTYNNINFGDNGTATINCGTIVSDGVEFTSDYRLKENIIPIPDEYSVDKLNPCVYNLKDSPEKLQTGFIAHELQEVFPHMVNGEKDGEDMQSVNYIQLIAILTKEIQDLKKRVLQLENTSF